MKEEQSLGPLPEFPLHVRLSQGRLRLRTATPSSLCLSPSLS